MAAVYSYDEMERMGLPLDILEEMRCFGYGRYDSFDGFDCISLEMLDYENLLLSRGSVLLYLEAERRLCFTSRKEEVAELFCRLEEKYPTERLLYGFFQELMRKDEVAFDAIEKEIMELEQALIATGKGDCVAEIINLRKRLMVLKKYYEQLLNVLDILIQNEKGLFSEAELISFRMLYRRVERRFQNVLNLRESVTQVRESYEAEVDISLNKTMKLFTVVTTIFLPLTLIVGWYGMNFDMPEYSWESGYLFVTAISVLFVVGGILFFWKKKWF